MKKTRTHFVLPDVQAKPGKPIKYLRAIGHYMLAKRPDVVVCIGDFADMPSLSSYDKGKKSFEGRRYEKDVSFTKEAMEMFLGPLREFNLVQAERGLPLYQPRMVMTLGNHEHRIARAVEDNPELDGLMGVEDLEYEHYGWEVIPFLEPIVIDGIAYCHYFTGGPMGRPVGTTAALLSKKAMSCIAGHQQGRQISTMVRADGHVNTAIICGSCYQHNEDYLGPQGNRHFRGFIVLHDVINGEFGEQFVPISHALEKHGAK